MVSLMVGWVMNARLNVVNGWVDCILYDMLVNTRSIGSQAYLLLFSRRNVVYLYYRPGQLIKIEIMKLVDADAYSHINAHMGILTQKYGNTNATHTAACQYMQSVGGMCASQKS